MKLLMKIHNMKKNLLTKYIMLLILLIDGIVIYFDLNSVVMGMKQWVELLVFEFTLQAYYTQYISNNDNEKL